jgi:hypothetical protein
MEAAAEAAATFPKQNHSIIKGASAFMLDIQLFQLVNYSTLSLKLS